jgi:hypothetical protein
VACFGRIGELPAGLLPTESYRFAQILICSR